MAITSKATVVKYFFKNVVFVVALFATHILCAAEWGAITNNLKMSMSLKGGGNQITNGQPCVLEIRYRNVSTNETIDVLRMNWVESDATYSFVVIDPSGKDISPNLNKPFGGSAVGIAIGPGQTQGLEYNLSGVCKIDEAGTYKITGKN